MTKADSVLSTPPLNSSAIQDANPPPEARGESVDSFSQPRAIGQPESENLASESKEPAKGLSRRLMLGGLAILPAALPAAAAEPDPIFAAIAKHKALAIPYDTAWKARGSCNDFGELTDDEKQHVRKLNDAIDEAGLPMEQAACELIDTVPTTLAGVVAAIRIIQAHYRADGEHMPNGEWLYEDEDDPKNGRDWLECFLDTIADAVTEMAAPRGVQL